MSFLLYLLYCFPGLLRRQDLRNRCHRTHSPQWGSLPQTSAPRQRPHQQPPRQQPPSPPRVRVGEDERRGSKRARAAGAKGEAGVEGTLGAPDSGLPRKGEGAQPMDIVDYELQRILKKERPLRSFEDLFLCSKKPDVFAGILTLMEDLDKEKKQQEVRPYTINSS